MADLAEMMQDYIDYAVGVLDPTPKRVIVHQPGEEVAWDSCCDGQLWARVITIQPGPIQPRANGLPCGVPWMNVTLGLGIIRCVEVVNDKGRAPSAAEITEDGAQMLRDLEKLQEAMLCTGHTTGVVAWTPLGPQGGCAGGEWAFTVRVPVCACPPGE